MNLPLYTSRDLQLPDLRIMFSGSKIYMARITDHSHHASPLALPESLLRPQRPLPPRAAYALQLAELLLRIRARFRVVDELIHERALADRRRAGLER